MLYIYALHEQLEASRSSVFLLDSLERGIHPMHAQRMLLKTPAALVAGLVALLRLAGCGSIKDILGGDLPTNTNSNSAAAAKSTATTPGTTTSCPTIQRPGITGTLKSIDSSTLVVVDTKGQ